MPSRGRRLSPASLQRSIHAAPLAATIVVAYLLAGGRWGSHIGAGPIYLTDVLLGCAIFHRWYVSHTRGRPAATGASERSNPGPILPLFCGWIAVRALSGATNVSLIALRDLAPYAYAVVGLVSARAYSRSTPSSRQRTIQVLRAALIFHLLWVLAAEFAPAAVHMLPGTAGNTGLFSLRRDFDGAVLGVLGGLTVFRMLLGQSTRYDRVWLIGTAAALASIASRAGLVGALAAIGIAVWSATGRSVHTGRRRSLVNATALIFMVGGLLVVAPSTSTGARVLATIDPGVARTEAQFDALGTANARSRSWGQLKEWVEEKPDRQLFGVGFGPDFLHESGADVLLLNREIAEVRSPHNFLLGTYARLGLIGLLLWSALALQALAAARRLFEMYQSEQLLLVASMTIAALIPAGMLGVIFESPFGAIPFYWSVGLLLSKPVPPSRRRRGPEGSRPRIHGGTTACGSGRDVATEPLPDGRSIGR